MKYSKVLLSITALSIASAGFSSGLYASTLLHNFSDVPNDHWAREAIAYVAEEGIMKGMSETTFAPDEPVTRAQLATVLYRTLNKNYLSDDTHVDINNALDYARDAQRRNDVNTILNAIYQYAIDNNGKLPFEFTSTKALEICKSAVRCPKNMVDLSELEEIYLITIPVDPESLDDISTKYTLFVDKQNRITISAPLNIIEKISVTR